MANKAGQPVEDEPEDDGTEAVSNVCCEFVDDQIDQCESKIAELRKQLPKKGKTKGAPKAGLDPETILALFEVGLQFWKMIRDRIGR